MVIVYMNNSCTKLKYYAINAKDYFYNPRDYCNYNNKNLKKANFFFLYKCLLEKNTVPYIYSKPCISLVYNYMLIFKKVYLYAHFYVHVEK